MGFFEALKNRRLFRITVAYLAGGWVALQVVDQVTTQGVLPAFVYELALIWYLVGIPVALVLGWYHGEKGAQRATRGEILLLLLLLALGITASGPTVSEELDRRMRLEAATEDELDLRRVAVLYFDDVSPRDTLQYLADGFTEALIDELATVRELDVVSRNGVGRFRGSEVPRDSVAWALRAGTLVEGTVEGVGDRIRVGVALVDGRSGTEYERAGFERPAEQLFATREELVDRTARLLREWLGEEVHLRTTRRETGSVTAWALYHRARRQEELAELALREHDLERALAAYDEADSLAARSALVDSTWADPSAFRAWIGYRRARIAAGGGEGRKALRGIEEGLTRTEEALARDPNHARALEVRGTLSYLRYLLGLEPDPDRRQRLLEAARRDLQRAVDLDPTLASAHATLSHLYTQIHATSNVVLAARRAYEEDAYLENADAVVWRIFTGSYRLEQFTEARRWCDVGRHRFSRDPNFVTCQLLLLTSPATAPDTEEAWRLAALMDSLAPAHEAEWERLRAEILVGGVLARAGLADSARNVWNRAHSQATAEVDETRWLRLLEAYMRTLVGDRDEAVELLEVYAAVNPEASFEDNWWWRDLVTHPEFQALTARRNRAGPAAH